MSPRPAFPASDKPIAWWQDVLAVGACILFILAAISVAAAAGLWWLVYELLGHISGC